MEIKLGTLVVVRGKVGVVTGCIGNQCWNIALNNGHLAGATYDELIPLCQIPEQERNENPEKLLIEHLAEVIASIAQAAHTNKNCLPVLQNRIAG